MSKEMKETRHNRWATGSHWTEEQAHETGVTSQLEADWDMVTWLCWVTFRDSSSQWKCSLVEGSSSHAHTVGYCLGPRAPSRWRRDAQEHGKGEQRILGWARRSLLPCMPTALGRVE